MGTESLRSGGGAWLAGGWLLVRVSLRRLLFSRQTVMNLLLFALAALAVGGWSLQRDCTPQKFVDEIVLPIYVSFLLPLFCLCYATPSIAADREDQTLVYLLATPLPRPLIYAAKSSAALLLTLAWTLGTWMVLSRLAGAAGSRAAGAFWPAAVGSTCAYVGLFLVFSAVLRRATIVAFVYALFLEAFLGNMPGIIKRVAISFYTQCAVLEASAGIGVNPSTSRDPALFRPIDGDTALLVLWVLAGVLWAGGCWLFSRREYV